MFDFKSVTRYAGFSGGSGYNLPPGVSAADKDAPWNQPDDGPDQEEIWEAIETTKRLVELLEIMKITFPPLGTLIRDLEAMTHED